MSVVDVEALVSALRLVWGEMGLVFIEAMSVLLARLHPTHCWLATGHPLVNGLSGFGTLDPPTFSPRPRRC
jgi:hypothetical protein